MDICKGSTVETTLTYAEIVLMAWCGECWARPGTMCPGGVFHQLRVDRAERKAGELLAAAIRSEDA